VKSVPGLVLFLLLAACAKREPSPAETTTAAEKPAPPVATIRAADQSPGTGNPPSAAAAKEPPVLTTATLISPPAAPVSAAGATPPVASSPDGLPPEALAKDGAAIFSQICATCHMADGYGVPYLQPKIKGSAWISNPDPQPLLSLILRGSAILGEASKAYENDMAPQDHLSDAEIAAVASYVRQRFAASPIAEPVTPAQVALARSRPGLP